MDDYKNRSYGAVEIGMRGKVGIVVVDYQLAFTEPKYPLGGAPLVMRGLENTARLLKVALAHNVPIATCFTAYQTERDMPHWKVAAVRDQFRLDHPSSAGPSDIR
ncbi:hypothetical protein [Caballeronia sp. dw_19]|uniref:hypothetical protein n=1 Tax=Caballeronia sp. dw_19 TaxID=2719791 RepID=UPI001BD2631E|nr:hypothetical protein [Caballeronia sp. dw_19]